MRITTISSSIASVVSRVIDCVAIAGSVRMPLHLTLMREHLGCWLERCLEPGFAYAGSYANYQAGNPKAGKQPGKPGQARQLRLSDIALAVRTAPSRLTSVSTRSRG